MKKSMQIEGLGFVEYEESVWSGKKVIFVDGKKAEKRDKKTFVADGKTLVLSGSFVTGAKLLYGGRAYVITSSPKWYEYVLALIPLMMVLTWGNSAALCAIFPIAGGAIGGAVGGLSLALQLTALKGIEKVPVKILLSFAMTVATVWVLYMLALALIFLI